MEKGTKESYIEGIAIHDGPESCVGVPRGRGEALTGGVQARLLSRETDHFQGADAVQSSGRQYRRRRYRESLADPARSKNQGMYASLHAREPGDPMIARQAASQMGAAHWSAMAAGRKGKAKVVTP